ncbi:Gfo/Idh/MocA family oxidoreductase [Lapillicoccus sp.]|uniref:Gfo/Idh/MocA family protein n=1 Tax=Lapillicoccus sp. TaxID=1909287 RepID=UPI0025EEF99D|nr:Gfo/Idh/MocA family oxidoreductase [Lapillicoccus sp.]
MTRVGLVGYGSAGRTFHAPLITAAGLDLVAVTTASPERVAQVRSDHPSALVVPDLAALLEVPDLDLVVVASPTGVHVEQARQVAEAGRAAVVDKPLAVDASGALEVCDVFAHEGAALTVFQNRRYDREFRTVQAVLASGDLGPIVRAELRWERWRPVPKDRWRENATAEQGGGLLLDLFSHLVDQAVLLFGPVTTVYAELAAHTTTAEDTAFLSCRHTSGVISHLGATTVAAAPGPRVRLLGERAAYVLAAQHDEETAFTEFLPQDGGHAGWLVRGDTREQVPVQPGEPADFYREVAVALASTDPQAAMPVDPRDAIHVLAVLDAARVSAAAGRVVEVITPGVVP